jgi:hypothetical protein
MERYTFDRIYENCQPWHYKVRGFLLAKRRRGLSIETAR